jgi:hypothetical protein
MEDRPIIRLKMRGVFPPENALKARAWLEKCQDVVNHALNVEFREEWELLQAEIRDAYFEWAAYGTPVGPALEAAEARYADRIAQHSTTRPNID